MTTSELIFEFREAGTVSVVAEINLFHLLPHELDLIAAIMRAREAYDAAELLLYGDGDEAARSSEVHGDENDEVLVDDHCGECGESESECTCAELDEEAVDAPVDNDGDDGEKRSWAPIADDERDDADLDAADRAAAEIVAGSIGHPGRPAKEVSQADALWAWARTHSIKGAAASLNIAVSRVREMRDADFPEVPPEDRPVYLECDKQHLIVARDGSTSGRWGKRPGSPMRREDARTAAHRLEIVEESIIVDSAAFLREMFRT